jgi:alpha-glucosidase
MVRTLLLALICGHSPLYSQTLASPNGRGQFQLTVEGGLLTYAVTFRSRPLIQPSPIGLAVDGENLGDGVALNKVERYRTNEQFAWHGVHSTASDRSNGARFSVRHKKSGLDYTVEARAYDDGVAFRTIVPGPETARRIPEEATSFRIPAGSTVWYHDFEGHYEAVHARKPIEQASAGDWAAPPVTFKLPGGAGYGAITEGALFRFAGLGLQADGKNGFAARLGHLHPPSYPFRLRYKDDIERMAKPAAIAGTITTPWRVILAAADLNTLVNADIVHAVAPAPDPKLFPQGTKTAWVKPGRSLWRYLDGGDSSLEGMRQFTNWAKELGFEYNLLEGFWTKWSAKELKDYVDYSRERGVGIILWKHSRDLRDPEKRRAFFELCRNAGVAGAKIDFFDHEAKEVVEQYEILLREAAESNLIVNFHGANKPTGEARTFPNELTREGIRGMESRRTNRAAHDATLPFTRMLAGHADYTPMVFSERRNDTTWAHQIATAAIFTSPLLVYGAHPKSILENPALEVIKSIPSVWDETIALPMSEIGEVAVFARRRGETWFLAVLNGVEARKIDVRLTFLGVGKYRSVLVRDAKDRPDAVVVEKREVGRGDSVTIEMLPGGGFAGMMSPIGARI